MFYIVCFKVKLSWLLGNLKREKSWDTYFTASCVYLFWREMFWGCKTHIAGNWIIKRFYLEFPFLEEDRSVLSQFPPIVIISPRKRIYQQRKASEFYCFFHLSLQKVILLLFLHSLITAQYILNQGISNDWTMILVSYSVRISFIN